MKTVKYTTGRDYGSPQVLEITFEQPSDDFESQFELFPVTFIDAVRAISGTVNVFGMYANEASIGKEVLAEYDAGRYQAI